MSKISTPLLAVVLALSATPALAGAPKISILHCGCAYDEVNGASMQFVPIEVHRRARGHGNHDYGSIESCYAGTVEVAEGVFEDRYIDFVRMAGDCQLGSNSSLRIPIAQCESLAEEMPQAGDLCGEEPWY